MGNGEESKKIADLDLNLAAFVQKVVKCYMTNIFRPSNKDEGVTILFNWPFFEGLQHAWTLLTSEDGRFPPADFTDSYLKVSCPLKSLSLNSKGI